MIVTNPRAEWRLAGQPFVAFHAGTQLSEVEMLTYYGLTPKDKNYAYLAKPSRFMRLVLIRESGSFVIIPVNNDVILKD